MTPRMYIFIIFLKKLFAEELQSVVFLANFYLMPAKIYDAGESTVCGITTALFPNKFIQVENNVCHTYKTAFCTQNMCHTFKSKEFKCREVCNLIFFLSQSGQAMQSKLCYISLHCFTDNPL